MFVAASGQLKALNFSASMLRDGRRVPQERMTNPWIIPATEAKPAEGDEQAELDAMAADFIQAFGQLGSDEIGIQDRQVLGWSCSYRKEQPEKRAFAHWRRRWSKARLRWSGIALQAPRHRRPQEEQLRLQETWAKRRRIGRKAGAAES